MHHSLRLLKITAVSGLIAGLAACGSAPVNPRDQVTGYPSQGQYPAQYPAQYPSNYPSQPQYPAQNQYPAQTQYPAQNQPNNYAEYGRVSNIESYQAQQQPKGTGLGAVLGGVAGAVAGRQIGGGTGRDVATVAGAVGGAVLGNSVEKNRNPAVTQTYRVTVQLDNGQGRAFDLASPGELRVGDRVRVQNGQIFRY